MEEIEGVIDGDRLYLDPVWRKKGETTLNYEKLHFGPLKGEIVA